MPLVVEDGSGVEDAATYATEVDLVAYAAARGVTISEDAAAPLLVKAMDRMTGLDYLGERVDRDQALDWPRACVVIDGFSYGSDELPKVLTDAQLAFAVAAKDTDLMPTVASDGKGQKIRTTVGPITNEWAQRPGGPSKYAKVPAADRLLAKLLRAGENRLKVVRA